MVFERAEDVERGLRLIPQLGEVMPDEAGEEVRAVYEETRTHHALDHAHSACGVTRRSSFVQIGYGCRRHRRRRVGLTRRTARSRPRPLVSRIAGRRMRSSMRDGRTTGNLRLKGDLWAFPDPSRLLRAS
jgi:hypothetical protein